MKRRSDVLLIIVLGVLPLASPTTSSREHAQAPEGKAVNSYREVQGGVRPAWVESAFKRSILHLTEHGKALGLVNPEAEVALAGADRDALGMTHVRLEQVFQGVPVFGSQLIIHMDTNSVRDLVSGRVYGSVRGVNTKPRIDTTQAIEAAKSKLGHTVRFTKKPAARLVLLPHQVKDPRSGSDAGATLVYLVELLIIDGTANTAHHYYFVDAGDGSIVWHYNNLTH